MNDARLNKLGEPYYPATAEENAYEAQHSVLRDAYHFARTAEAKATAKAAYKEFTGNDPLEPVRLDFARIRISA